MFDLHCPAGATPLDLDEAGALIPQHITTQGQLNEWEQMNILEAELWAFSKIRRDSASLHFSKQLHQRMFDKTWKWAGKWRKSDKNIGIDWRYIETEQKKLFDDVSYQVLCKSYSLDEIGARFHHRLVFIHPFPNGNGRHARLMTDIFLVLYSAKRFSWGKSNLAAANNTRAAYIAALRAADNGNYVDLLNFVRS